MPRSRRLALRPTIIATACSSMLVTVAGYGTEGCQSPTQITVELRTVGALPCTSLKGVAIVVAKSARDAEDKMKLESLSALVPRGSCEADGRTIGTLVITPQDSTGAIVVRARYSDDPTATCKAPDYKGCIIARRSFAFIDHTPVRLPISLEAACVDVPCDVESSCRSGTCVSSQAVCSDTSRTCDSPAEPVIAADGDAVPADGALLTDGAGHDASVVGEGGDATLDGPIDAPPDVDPSTFGNACPTAGGGVDCNAQAQVCCYMGSYFCGTGCPMGYYVFNCLGRKHCSGGYCCGLPPGGGANPKGSSCDTTGGQMCAQNGSHYICTTDSDCPPTLPKCNGVYYNVGTGTTKECTAN